MKNRQGQGAKTPPNGGDPIETPASTTPVGSQPTMPSPNISIPGVAAKFTDKQVTALRAILRLTGVDGTPPRFTDVANALGLSPQAFVTVANSLRQKQVVADDAQAGAGHGGKNTPLRITDIGRKVLKHAPPEQPTQAVEVAE